MGIKDTVVAGALGTLLSVGGAFDANAQDSDNNKEPTEITQQDQQVDLSAIKANSVRISVDGSAVGGRGFSRGLAAAKIQNGQDAKDFADTIISRMEDGSMPIPAGYNNGTTQKDEDHVPVVQIDIMYGADIVHTIKENLGEDNDQAPEPKTPDGP